MIKDLTSVLSLIKTHTFREKAACNKQSCQDVAPISFQDRGGNSSESTLTVFSLQKLQLWLQSSTFMSTEAAITQLTLGNIEKIMYF